MNEIDLDFPLARSRTAEVPVWGDGYILKLFHNWFPPEDVEYEMKIARAVHASGVNSPVVTEAVQVQGCNNLIDERVAGASMLRLFQRKPWNLIRHGKLLARLHAQMHECVLEAENIPMRRKRLQKNPKHNCFASLLNTETPTCA